MPTPEPPPELWKNPFINVFEGDWFYGDVEYVYTRGLMLGIRENTFEPKAIMSRAIVFTVLTRMANEPTGAIRGTLLPSRGAWKPA